MPQRSRRDFMRHSLLGLAVLPLSTGLLARPARAQELPRLDPSDEHAKALNYVEVAEQARDHPAYEPGQRCSSCLFYQADRQGCQIFPQNSVAPGGWCQSWSARD